MNIIEKLKQKLTARRQDSVTRYWSTLTKIAEGNLSDRAADAALEAIEELVAALSKSEDGVDADLALLREHATAKVVAEAAANDRATAADLRADVVRLDQQFADLHAQAERVRAQSEDARNRSLALVASADRAVQDLARTHRRLAEAGHPEFAPRAADVKEREVQALLGELAALEVGTNYNLRGRSPEGRRNEIAARLAALGAPVDEERLTKPLPGRRRVSAT